MFCDMQMQSIMQQNYAIKLIAEPNEYISELGQ